MTFSKAEDIVCLCAGCRISHEQYISAASVIDWHVLWVSQHKEGPTTLSSWRSSSSPSPHYTFCPSSVQHHLWRNSQNKKKWAVSDRYFHLFISFIFIFIFFNRDLGCSLWRWACIFSFSDSVCFTRNILNRLCCRGKVWPLSVAYTQKMKSHKHQAPSVLL